MNDPLILRTISYLQSLQNPVAADFHNIASYFEQLANNVPVDPVDPIDPNNTKDVIYFPNRPAYTLGALSGTYGVTLLNGHISGTISGAISAGILARGDCTMDDLHIFNIGNDAVKLEYGSAIIKRAHFHNLGYAAGAHADCFQNRGFLTNLEFEDTFFDVPTNKEGNPNAGIIVDSSQGACSGDIYIRRCLGRGGNKTYYLGDKQTGNRVPECFVSDSPFIVEMDSPRHDIFERAWAHKFHFDNCGVYYYDGNSENRCVLVEANPHDFNAKQWHLDMFGRVPIGATL